MRPGDRARLTKVLQGHVGRAAADLRRRMLEPGAVRERARALHGDEGVGEDFEAWTDLLARRAAVLWALKSVYVRVLEDRGLLRPGRILDREAQDLFERLAPNLGETAFLRWIYRDLAGTQGGLPELFGLLPAEVATPSDALSRELLETWRHQDADTGERFSFADERFDGELMGDLYQELDPVAKGRYALCQTPGFIRDFILDRTLTPAIEARGAARVRLLDPACGSGHFLIDGLKRLAAATAEAEPGWDRVKVVRHCLERVVGIDLNDYACALARARLVMTAAELAGLGTLAEAAELHPHVYWADGLEQVEREELKQGTLYAGRPAVEPRATLTRPEVKTALKAVLEGGFEVVVANPPYIVERDPARKEYHRERVGRTPRYVSAYRGYHLSCPFTERCFQLAVEGGEVGLIVDNQFMKREYGKPFIETVLAGKDLWLVVDTSQIQIPHHGTPTVLLFARSRGPRGKVVHAVMGKRGETGKTDDPARGRVWTSIREGWQKVGFENEFVSVAEVPREVFGKHPWSLGGSEALEVKGTVEEAAQSRLVDCVADTGRTVHTGLDDAYYVPGHVARRFPRTITKPLVIGEDVRDWRIEPGLTAIAPYDANLRPFDPTPGSQAHEFLWRYKALLAARVDYGKSMPERGLRWFEWSMFFANRLRTPLSIAFAFVATHNHFVLDRGGKVFKQSAPVVKLKAGASEDDHLALLGLLNSSTLGFWMRQVFHDKGSGGVGGGYHSEKWSIRLEYDATKLKLAPLVGSRAPLPYARALDGLARERTERSVPAVLAATTWRDARTLRAALDARRTADLAGFERMVGLQEELDWLVYSLYGLDDAPDLVPAGEAPAVIPTWLPWVLELADRDAETREALARGEETTEMPTAWFERHGWEPLRELPDTAPADYRERVETRRARIRANPTLALLEQPAYKRRWYRPDHAREEAEALRAWLADRVEMAVKARAAPSTLDQVAADLQGDPRTLAVSEVLTGRRDFHLAELVAETLRADAVPGHPYHVYTAHGLETRKLWEECWELQRREDAGEDVKPSVPPKYGKGDFLRGECFALRGTLDVPKERFIAFTEVPGRPPGDLLYGWAGWTALERIRAILGIDETLEDAEVPLGDRIGLLDSAWRLLPDAAREDAQAAGRLKAEIQALLGSAGPSREMLAEWKGRFPPPGAPRARSRKKGSP